MRRSVLSIGVLAIVAGSVSGVASASTVVFDDFSVNMNPDPSAIVTQTPAVWGDPLGSSLDRVMQGGNTGAISGGLWGPGFFDLLSYQDGSGVDRSSYTGLYFDFVGAGTLEVSVGGSVSYQVNGMANERVFLDFASLSGVDANNPDIVLINSGFGTTLGEIGFQASAVPGAGLAGLATVGLAGVSRRRRR